MGQDEILVLYDLRIYVLSYALFFEFDLLVIEFEYLNYFNTKFEFEFSRIKIEYLNLNITYVLLLLELNT